MILPDVLYLAAKSIGSAALDATMAPGTLQPWVDEIEARVARDGKFSALAVAYFPLSPPPLFWDYKCRKCRSWREPNACAMVEGEISPIGWCAIWVPPPSYKAFSWPGELLEGKRMS